MVSTVSCFFCTFQTSLYVSFPYDIGLLRE